jgi:mobilization protein NikA
MTRLRATYAGERRTSHFGFQLTPSERMDLERRAEDRGMVLAEFVRACCLLNPGAGETAGTRPRLPRTTALLGELGRVGTTSISSRATPTCRDACRKQASCERRSPSSERPSTGSSNSPWHGRNGSARRTRSLVKLRSLRRLVPLEWRFSLIPVPAILAHRPAEIGETADALLEVRI